MTEQELDRLVASLTPERLRNLVFGAKGTFRLRGRTAVPVEILVNDLTSGLDTGEGAEKQHILDRLHDAILATARQMPDARCLRGT